VLSKGKEKKGIEVPQDAFRPKVICYIETTINVQIAMHRTIKVGGQKEQFRMLQHNPNVFLIEYYLNYKVLAIRTRR
jgi:hypothetical protein